MKDYSTYTLTIPFLTLKTTLLNTLKDIDSNNLNLQMIKSFLSRLRYISTIDSESISYYRSDKRMQVSVYYNEEGKTLQEIIEQFFEEYCISL